ncbi:IS3 family transposase [Streptomyces sp. NBC_01724]|uniref:IS3 family transposase n=1 Tax=Streptomyces sp. NBC_01724 TaxID=2975922 RepID=UPI003FCEE46C
MPRERHPEGGVFLRGRARPATHALVTFVDEFKDRFGGVEPICRTLTEYDCKIAPSTYYAAKKRQAASSARRVSDAVLKELITEVHEINFRVYGARKVWRELHRQVHEVARCTVERLMRELGITGAVRGRKVITTVPDGSVERAPDLLDRRFVASALNRCWVADFTYVRTWSGIVYVAFVVDTFSRRITGWSASHSKETQLVLDALVMALRQTRPRRSSTPARRVDPPLRRRVPIHQFPACRARRRPGCESGVPVRPRPFGACR